jgi:hypothetical protein
MRLGLALLGTLVIALSVAVASASPIDKPMNFALLEVDESDASTDLGFEFNRLPKPGEGFAFKSGIYKWAGTKRGARIGHDMGVCTFVRVGQGEQFTADAHCSAAIFLPGGAIELDGFIHLAEGPLDSEVPVVGGTGKYSGVRGHVRIRNIGGEDSNNSAMEFHLLP